MGMARLTGAALKVVSNRTHALLPPLERSGGVRASNVDFLGPSSASGVSVGGEGADALGEDARG